MCHTIQQFHQLPGDSKKLFYDCGLSWLTQYIDRHSSINISTNDGTTHYFILLELIVK